MKLIRIALDKKIAFINVADKEDKEEIAFYYTSKYIKENKEQVKNTLKDINTTVYKDEYSYFVLNKIIESETIIFDYKDSLSTRVLESLLKNKHLKKIECYFIPSDYLHKFSERNISVIFNNDYSFDSNFVLYNGFNNLKDIYYTRSINFYSRKEIFNNLDYFLNVNKSLKVINLYYYSKESVKYIIDKLEEKKKYDVNIFIYQNLDNNELITRDLNYLKKLNKMSVNQVKIIYEEEYFKNTIFKVLTFNGVKIILVFLVYVGLILMLSNAYHEYMAAIEVRKIELSLLEASLLEVDEIDDVTIEEPIEEPAVLPEEENEPYSDMPTSLEVLRNINPNTVGWIKVNNTKVNYPVVQGIDNEHYLNYDFYENYMISGWVFMDYRVSNDPLVRNTIIYGHNMRSGLMFGSLQSTTDYDWYTNPENQIITFNTFDGEQKYKIFSIYRVDTTSDYLRVSFQNDKNFIDFTNMVKERSVYDFGVTINNDDNILTLSTCSSNNRKLVIHAVKID